ncbi:MAG: SanA/YdcF family protein [Eubacteriales bacterium]
MKTNKALKKLALAALAVFSFALYANISVNRAGQTGVYSVESSPQAEAAIILGARVYESGGVSQVLADRLETGIELYKKGKVKKLLLTGDHGQKSYDEVNQMRIYALRRGIPEGDIFMDHAGFSTYDSMYRARDVFRVKSVLVVTQDFHLPRALYIARWLGLEAHGVSADKRVYVGQNYLYFRELLARTKAVAQLALGMKPKYLGPAIPITGDGRATKDTRI